jgi:hypothetical protein
MNIATSLAPSILTFIVVLFLYQYSRYLPDTLGMFIQYYRHVHPVFVMMGIHGGVYIHVNAKSLD